MKQVRNLRRFVSVLAGLSVSFIGGALVVAAQDEMSGRRVNIDEVLKTGFAALSRKNYGEARKSFEQGVALMEKTPEASHWLFTKIALPDEDPSDVPRDPTVRGIMGFRHSMGTHQALRMFSSFAAQLEGDPKLANKYLAEVYGMQGVTWGLSWRVFIPPLQALFYSSVAEDSTENYARYLALNGQLLWSAGEKTGLKLVKDAHKRLPKDPEIAAKLAGYLVIQLEAAEARSAAEIALAANPKQGRVLIDLATAEWLLGETDAAEKHAAEAQKLEPSLPGPHATLALVAIEKGDLQTAAKEAKMGVELSERHPFYLLVQAIAFEASGKNKESETLLKEAWNDPLPQPRDLERWYIRGKPMVLVTAVLGRLKK